MPAMAFTYRICRVCAFPQEPIRPVRLIPPTTWLLLVSNYVMRERFSFIRA